MKAIILAAGYGNRMRPLTDNRHKTLLTVGAKTILGRIIDGLAANNIRDIVLVTGYRAEELHSFMDLNYGNLSVTYVHNSRYKETNNIYSLALALDSIAIDSDIIIIESDLVFDPLVIKQLLDSRFENIALVDKYRSGMDGTVVTVDNSIITSVIPSHLQDDNFDFSDKYKTLNIYKFSRSFCETSFKKLLTYYARVIDDNCYYELVLGILIYMQRETIHAEIVATASWAEVDDPNDLAVAEYTFNQNRLRILEEGFGGYWNYDLIDFCFIRNMYFPDSSIISELKNNLSNCIHNYGSRQKVLNTKMSWFLGCESSRVLTLNGASQLYPILGTLFANKKALIPSPTFGEYTRIFPEHITYSDTVGINIKEIRDKAVLADVIIFVNPNNPTGTELDTEEIYTYAKEHPGKTIVVDESFIEFSRFQSIISLIEQTPCNNIIVLKSLSKSLGVPGIRLGYCYTSNQDLLEKITHWIPIWNTNSLAEFLLEILLKHRKTLAETIALTKQDRTRFVEILKTTPIIDHVYNSGANFILAQLKRGQTQNSVVSYLLDNHNIYIKDCSNKFNDGRTYIRLAVRLPEENQRLCTLLSELGS